MVFFTRKLWCFLIGSCGVFYKEVVVFFNKNFDRLVVFSWADTRGEFQQFVAIYVVIFIMKSTI